MEDQTQILHLDQKKYKNTIKINVFKDFKIHYLFDVYVIQYMYDCIVWKKLCMSFTPCNKQHILIPVLKRQCCFTEARSALAVIK